MKRWIPIWGCILASMLAGCNDNNLGIDKRTANRPPETTLAAGPPDSTTSAAYKVHLYWSGSDPDGTVDHYDFIMVDHPAAKDNIRGDGPNPVIITVPEPDDPRWLGTTATDSTFITLADTLRNETYPSDSTGTAEEIRNLNWERWHTFFIRAVDNEGVPDPTPQYRSFNSVNIAPLVWLTDPVKPNATFNGPPVVIFNWDGEDDSGGDLIDPVASRWVLIDSQIDSNKQPINLPESLYVLPERYEWSEWARWDAEDQSGRRAILRSLNEFRVVETPPVGPPITTGFYVFAVQAMDEAGAISPVFDNKIDRRNNAVGVRISGLVGPVLTVSERFLGTTTWLGGSKAVSVEIAAGQPLSFRWLGDADRYGGEIEDYRYGWDISDPENDDEWEQNWCASCVETTPRTFSSGTHTLFIQVRDNAESITLAKYILRVNQVTRARDVLWVDDTFPINPTSRQEVDEDARWLQIFTELAAENDFQFDVKGDVFDVDNEGALPPINLVFNYKSVVWSVRSTGFTAINSLARFVDPFLSANRNSSSRAFNFLGIYLANKGHLCLHGERVALQLWPQLWGSQPRNAVNVTNWDGDQVEKHPFRDSVGTLSLLYAMGVEMFDCGAGLGCGPNGDPRTSRDQLCQGLEKAVPQFSETQQFATDIYNGHAHGVTVNTSDVDVPGGPVDVTYTTTMVSDHSHQVTVTAADFLALQQGATISLETTAAAIPENHTHFVDMVDQRGLWGAPVLSTGATWAPDPPNTGRPNVEIYNMPGEMSTEQPPLRPRPGISTPLYTFVSKVKAGSGNNYPATADKQPVAILAKGDPSDPFYSRAICGFEPEWLSYQSHKDLVRFILVRHFRAGIGDAP